MVTSFPALTVTPCTTFILKLRVIVQTPFVAVTVYIVLTVGERTGLRIIGLLTPVAGDQEKEAAEPVKLGTKDDPEQMVVSSLLFNDKGITVTLNTRDKVQVPRVAVRVYVVVTDGESTGLAIFGLPTPVIGNQEKLLPLLTIPALNEAPEQIVVSGRLFIERLLVNVIVTG